MKNLLYVVLVAFGFITLVPALASAQTALPRANINVTAAASTTVKTPMERGGVELSATASANMKSRAHQELQRRIDTLTLVNTRVQGMQAVTPAFKQTLASTIQTQISVFQALDAKIQADTDSATLKTDVQSITQSYRVYALVMPQIRIAAAADRGVTIATMMQGVGVKLAARVQEAGNAGANVTALTAALNDLAAKIADANTQAQASVSSTATLEPDNGDKTKMDSNTAALKKGRTTLAAVEADLKAARADITTVIKGLQAIGPVKANATASSTTSVQ